MPRWFVVFVLAFLLPCYGFAAVGQSLAVAVAIAVGDDGHAAAHVAEEAHHHEDDGSFYMDDSAESIQHLCVTDGATCAALIATGLRLPSVLLCCPAPPSWGESPPPMPFLAGLRRPPRSITLLS